MNVDEAALRRGFRNEALVGNVEEFCAPPQSADEVRWTPCYVVRGTRLATFHQRPPSEIVQIEDSRHVPGNFAIVAGLHDVER